MPPRLAIILKGYPRLSETFIAQEIRALELRGFELCIISLRHPYDPDTHPIHSEIKAPVYYLPEYVHDDIPRVLRACLWVCWKSGFWRSLVTLLRDLRRDPTRNRIRRFAQALVMAHEIPISVRHYYTHFMHTPASVSYYASKINRRSWSVSAHAKDICADWVVTCTAANKEYLSNLAVAEDQVTLLYHGLDFDRFDQKQQATVMHDGSDPGNEVRLISVGRTVDKKGYEFLLAALAMLPATLYWRFVHIGGGELLEQLQQQAHELGIDERIEWMGALPQTEVLAQYRAADLFVLPSKISEDGDRDGLPNVLMEAQSQNLACLSIPSSWDRRWIS
jgi:glycosyltransferase involved in cell wall biosynthesis